MLASSTQNIINFLKPYFLPLFVFTLPLIFKNRQKLSNLFFTSKNITYPPKFSYFFSALTGKFAFKENGPIKLLQTGYKQMGEIFRFRFLHKNITVLIGPKPASVLFSATDSEVTQREIYNFMKPVFGKNIAYDASPEIMSQQLRWVHQGLNSTIMATYTSKIFEETKNYLNNWSEEGECDIHKKMSELTIFTAARCLLGDEVRKHVTSKFGPMYQNLSDGVSHLSVFFPHFPTKDHKKRDLARKEINDLFKKVIEKRRKSGQKANDFLQHLMDSKYRNGVKSTDDEIIGCLVATLFGGQHTSTIAATWVLMMVAKYKDKYLHRLLDEQKKVLNKYNGKYSVESVDEMIFLQYFVQEILRLFPPLIILARLVHKPLRYKQYTIPPGDIIITSPSVAHRLPHIFKNPDEFDPDRFTEPRVEDSEKFAYIPFGGGRHICIGKRFGMMQIKVVCSVFLQMFDFECVDKNWEPIIDYGHIVAGPIDNTYLRYKKKSKEDAFFKE